MALSEQAHAYWFTRKVRPNQLLVSDISIETKWHDHEPRLELNNVPVAQLVDEHSYDPALEKERNQLPLTLEQLDRLPASERGRLQERHDQYGWMRALRPDDGSSTHCRWVHVSSTLPEHLSGAFQGVSDWRGDGWAKVEALRDIGRHAFEEERYSKHGKMFSPFLQALAPGAHAASGEAPMLLCVPYLDWGLHPRKPTPPLRFQVDEREHFFSSQQATHPLRSLLQYQYRLEDTSEREFSQVFAKHRPWYTDREVDLKVRRWYGHHPASVVVDELWILVVDARHIVTFASNQTWKSRWPPLQLASRIGEVSFRGIRDMFRASGLEQDYTAVTHAVACLHGSLGLMHRSFWTDMPLPCTDRYGGYLSHLQYRIYKQPSTKLVMDLLQVQDELNIVLHITNHQLRLIEQFADLVKTLDTRPPSRAAWDQSTGHGGSGGGGSTTTSTGSSRPATDAGRSHALQPAGDSPIDGGSPSPPPAGRRRLKPWLHTFAGEGDMHLFSLTAKPIATVERKLRRELDDLTELRNNANELVNRTVQLVNIRIEDNGQAIMVFTVITIIFLPLSFVSSLFGMNVAEFSDSSLGIGYFWAAGLGLTAIVVGLSVVLAFYGPAIREAWGTWRAGYDAQSLFTWPRRRPKIENYRVHRTSFATSSRPWR